MAASLPRNHGARLLNRTCLVEKLFFLQHVHSSGLWLAPSQLPMAAHIHRHAATLLDPLHLPVPEGRLQVRALQLDRELRDAMRPAEGARLEGLLGLVVALPPGAWGPRAGAHVARDVEGVALAVAEAVDHGAAMAARLADGLAEGLGLAPVSAEVAALGDHQGLPAGGQHLRLLLHKPVMPL